MAGFSVNIGADTAELSMGIKEAKAEIISFNNSLAAGGNSKVFESLNSGISNLNASIKQLIGQIENIPQSVAKSKASVKDFGEVAEGSILEARLTVNRLKAELISLGPAARQSEAGRFLANELKVATAELKAMEVQAGLTSGGTNNLFKQAFSGLRTIANILPGIGVAGLIGFATEPIIKYVTGLFSISAEAKKAQEELKKLKDSLNSPGDVTNLAVGGEQGNIAKVQALANAVKDSNLPYVERKRALEDLVQINKQYFGDLKLEESQMGLLTQRVNDYTQAITKQAILKGFTDEIGKVSVEIVKAEKELNNFKKARDKAAEKVASRNEGEIFNFQNDRLIKDFKKADEAFVEQRNKVEALGVNFAELKGKISEAAIETLKFDNIKPDKKREDTLGKQLSLLEKIRDAAKEFQGKLFDLKDIDAATDKLANLEQQVGNLKLQIAVRDAKKAGLPASEIENLKDAIKQDTQKRLNDAFQKEALLLEFNPKLKFSQVIRADIPTNTDSAIAKVTGLDKKIPIITIQEARIKILGFKKGNIINQTEEILKELNKQISQTIKQGVGDAFAGIGDAFGEALTSGDFGEGLKKAAQSILGILGGVLQQIGRQVITAALAIKALKATLEKWAIANPTLAIVAGIGLVALGAALKNTKFEGPKFATGGIISGPVIGQIGEMHRPEVILPLDRLPQMLRSIGGGGGNDGLQLLPIINNEGLYLAVKRGERRAGRKF